MRVGKEAWILGALIVAFVAATAVFSQRDLESEARQRPSSYSLAAEGTAGLYGLFGKEGFPVRRWERPITALNGRGLLVIAEPVARDVSPTEIAALWKWINFRRHRARCVTGTRRQEFNEPRHPS